MGPYRSNRGNDTRQAPKEGLVADMVKQFADPFAFLRELVQNAIDADASMIQVSVSVRPDGALCTSVTDDGCGMTLETIEGPFLTLFASSKEGVAGKIGKYGVGFMSVFGLDPAQVVVETWRAEGSYVVTLERDFSYVVHAGIKRGGHGTRVEQVIAKTVEPLAQHATRVELALRRWCRHAARPIVLEVRDADGQYLLQGCRIDTPISIACPVSVSETTGDETIVVGYEAGSAFLPGIERLPEGAGEFAGFYNRGLTLYETTAERFPGLEGLRFKVMSPSLQHTLSRDNVRRDAGFAALLRRVAKLARELLPSALQREWADRAETFARTASAPADYMAVLVAATAHLERARIVLPLVEPMDGQLTFPVDRILASTPDREPCLIEEASNDVTRAFVALKRPVVLAGPARTMLPALLGPSEVALASAVYAVFRATETTEAGERLMLDAMHRTLGSAGAAVASVSLCTASGAVPGIASIVVPADANQELLASVNELGAWRQRWGRGRRVLWLRRDDPAVELALRQARAGAPEQAACLLARVVLLEWRGAITPDANDALLARALDAAWLAEEGR